MQIIQLLPTLAFGDAVGNDARAIKKILQSAGYQTQIYAENIDPRLPVGTAEPFEKLPSLGHSDVLIYHLSVGSSINDCLDAFRCRKMMIYHNITPPSFFSKYSLLAQHLSSQGLEDMRRLNSTFDYCLADSAYNRKELREAGYACPIDVCPVLIPFSDYLQMPDTVSMDRLSDGRTNIVFVGRVAPHKKQEDIIRIFSYYKKHFDRKARLLLVGADGGMECYTRDLWKTVWDCGLQNGDVEFLGHVGFSTILAVYRAADLFLCMSEHEGFCVPLIEAMMFDVPIIAYAASAVPDTLGGCGVLMEDKVPDSCAMWMHRLLADDVFWYETIQRQRQRLQDFSEEKTAALLLEKISGFLKESAAQ